MKVAFKDYETGQPVAVWELNPSQQRFWDSEAKYVLFSGGFGCGKSLMLILKAIQLSLQYPKNFSLMGRKTYQELRDSLWKEFFIICPEHLIKSVQKAEMRITFINDSEIIFRHLDKIAESEIKSMNLGAAFIDQVEDISKEVFLALVGRLRRNTVHDKDKRIYMTANPALTWLYADFKQSPIAQSELIEASTLENRKNLSEAYVQSLLEYPETWRRQYVEGVWDASLLSDRTVFAREYIERLMRIQRKPMTIKDGLEIYKYYKPGHVYQMGIDSAEGHEHGDEAAITIADLTTLEEAASWSGRVPPDVAAEYAIRFARMYQRTRDRVLIIPEINSMGMSVMNKLLAEPDMRVYKREEFDKKTGQRTEKHGWRMSRTTKPLLVSRFQELMRIAEPQVYSTPSVEQFKTFVYTTESKLHGMGAQQGFHDDRLIATLLAFWQKKKPVRGMVGISQSTGERPRAADSRILTVQHGKLVIGPKPDPNYTPMLEVERTWRSM